MNTSVKKKFALLVGDSFFIHTGFAELFQKYGYEIVSIGSEGTEIIAGLRLKPEVIIVDYMMEHNDPYLTVALLHKSLPESYIAIMNGYIQHCNQEEAKSSGVKKILNRVSDISDYEAVFHGIEEEVYL